MKSLMKKTKINLDKLIEDVENMSEEELKVNYSRLKKKSIHMIAGGSTLIVISIVLMILMFIFM